MVDRRRDLHRFVKELIRLRLHFDKASLEDDLTLTQFLALGGIYWHGVKLQQPDWGPEFHSLAATAVSLTGARVFHLICNAYWEALSFELPRLPDEAAGGWRRLLDTALPSPEDICEEAYSPNGGGTYVSGSASLRGHAVLGYQVLYHTDLKTIKSYLDAGREPPCMEKAGPREKIYERNDPFGVFGGG